MLDEFWTNDFGYGHNPLGPSYLKYDRDGILIYFIWMLEGLVHRVDGPAVYSLGLGRAFYYHGEKYDFDFWIEKVRDEISEERYLELKAWWYGKG